MEIIKHFSDYIKSINEGLIKTYPGDVVLKDILNTLKDMFINVSGSFDDDKIILRIDQFNEISLNKIENLFDHINSFIINRGGWFPSNMFITNIYGSERLIKYNFYDIISNHNNIVNITITYESKFDRFDMNVPDKLYHLSIKEYSKKINKYGLIPRSKSKLSSHLDRIYLCKNYQDCIDLIPKMLFYYTGEKDENIYKLGKKLFNKDITPVIYEIDNSDKLINKLFLDINYNEKGYYTLSNIKPDRITTIKYI